MVTIYCIEDINDLKYVGSTKLKLSIRLSSHRCSKNCSSSKLNLHNCIIYSLETCNESNRKERERYWINHIDCVNEYKLNSMTTEYTKQYYKQWCDNNKEQIKEYRENNKDQKKKFNKEYYLFNKKSVVNGCYEFINMLNEY